MMTPPGDQSVTKKYWLVVNSEIFKGIKNMFSMCRHFFLELRTCSSQQCKDDKFWSLDVNYGYYLWTKCKSSRAKERKLFDTEKKDFDAACASAVCAIQLNPYHPPGNWVKMVMLQCAQYTLLQGGAKVKIIVLKFWSNIHSPIPNEGLH